MPILISIADCNHGFFEPENEECDLISQSGIDVRVIYQNCNQNNIVDKCQGSDIIAVQRLFLNKDVLSQIPSCKVVVRLGVGLDNINIDDMKELGIRVVYFPGFCTEEVANHALSMIMSLYRRLHIIRDHQQELDESLWGRPILLDGVKCARETTVGVLGVGRIGTEVIKRLRVCGFKVIACDPYVHVKGIDFVDINTLFIKSDIVTIHCALTDETRNMVNYELIRKMKKGSYLVNTARGGIVVSEDLLHALSDNHLRSAYVDVYNPEPADCQSLLHKNLYVTPHISFYSRDSLDWLKRELVRKSVKAFYDMQCSGNNLS